MSGCAVSLSNSDYATASTGVGRPHLVKQLAQTFGFGILLALAALAPVGGRASTPFLVAHAGPGRDTAVLSSLTVDGHGLGERP